MAGDNQYVQTSVEQMCDQPDEEANRCERQQSVYIIRLFWPLPQPERVRRRNSETVAAS